MSRFMTSSGRRRSGTGTNSQAQGFLTSARLPRVASLVGEDRRRALTPAVRSSLRGSSGRTNSRRPPSSIGNPGRLDLNIPAPDPDVAVEGLRLIIKKDLTVTDVGPLKRIVLPKNCAEANLPVLKNRDGRNLRMHDIETFQLWEFKYKYWPNNRGRMYILENTGHYVETHGLQAGDCIMIYKDETKGHLMIRSKKAEAEEANNPPQFDEIFDSIVPDFKVAGPRYSDLFSSWDQGISDTDFDLAFQPLPFSDEAASTSGSSAAALDWSPSSSRL